MSDELKEELLLEFKEEVETKILERYLEFNKRKKDESFYNELMDMSEEIYSYIKEFHKSFLENPEAYINFLFPRDNHPPTMDYFFSCVDSKCSESLSKLMKSVEKLLKEKYSEKLGIFEVKEEIKKKYAFEMWKENLHKLVEDVEIPREVLGTYREFAQENWGENGEKNLENHFGRCEYDHSTRGAEVKKPAKKGRTKVKIRKGTTKEAVLRAVENFSNGPNFHRILEEVEKINPKVDAKYLSVVLSQLHNEGFIDKDGKKFNYRYYPIREEPKYGIVVESMRENSCDIKKAKESAEKKGVNPKIFDPLLSYAVKKGLIERKGEPRNYEYYFQEN